MKMLVQSAIGSVSGRNDNMPLTVAQKGFFNFTLLVLIEQHCFEVSDHCRYQSHL